VARAPRTLLAKDLEDLAPYHSAWDGLAVAAGRPFAAPAWMLAWWREGRTGDARLRVVVVLDGDEPIGIGPFFAQVGPLGLAEYRLLGAGFCHRVGPIAAAGREEEVAAAIAAALAAADPAPASVVFEGIDARDRWPDQIRDHWPTRAQLRADVAMDSPAIDLSAGYDEWLGRRDRKFRKEARRVARRLEEEGVSRRIAADDAAIEALLRLHYQRWDDRGGSNVGAEARAVLVDAARGLAEDGRLQIALLEGPDGPIAAELVLRAGETAVFWGGGFDPAWSKLAPGMQTMLLALEDAAAAGVEEADLGGGAHEYKRRLADADRPVVWRTLLPVGARYPLIRLRLAPKHVRWAARDLLHRLPPRWQERIDRLRRR